MNRCGILSRTKQNRPTEEPNQSLEIMSYMTTYDALLECSRSLKIKGASYYEYFSTMLKMKEVIRISSGSVPTSFTRVTRAM